MTKYKTIGLLLLTTLSLTFIGCGKTGQAEDNESTSNETGSSLIVLSKEAQENINLETELITENNLTGTIKIPGVMLPNQDNEALVGSLLEGRVNKVLVNVGSYVNQGQELMLIEGISIGEIESAFLKSKAQLDFTETNYKRIKLLYEQNISAQKSLLEAEAEYNKASAEFMAEDKRIHSIGLDDADILNDNGKNNHSKGLYSIKAPISGVITERNVVIGQLIDPATNAFRIINTSKLLVEGQIFENDINKIAGFPEIKISTTTYPNKTFTGNVISISDVIDPNTRTIKLLANVNNGNKLLKPQMFCEISVPISGTAKGIIINEKCLIRDGNNFFVFVQQSDTTFEKIKVTLGSKINEKVEIVKGLKLGDKIVTDGVFDIKSEMLKETFGEEE
ncbi:MAG: efflux RND transporter periplasmic adaptor subunit [bacterium]